MHEPNILIQLIPYAVMTLLVAIFALILCPRKGKNRGYAALCLIPVVQYFVFFWLISLTDKSVLDRLAVLEGRA
jgi:ACR3 family arsenite efflux pump ArsB